MKCDGKLKWNRCIGLLQFEPFNQIDSYIACAHVQLDVFVFIVCIPGLALPDKQKTENSNETEKTNGIFRKFCANQTNCQLKNCVSCILSLLFNSSSVTVSNKFVRWFWLCALTDAHRNNAVNYCCPDGWTHFCCCIDWFLLTEWRKTVCSRMWNSAVDFGARKKKNTEYIRHKR